MAFSVISFSLTVVDEADTIKTGLFQDAVFSRMTFLLMMLVVALSTWIPPPVLEAELTLPTIVLSVISTYVVEITLIPVPVLFMIELCVSLSVASAPSASPSPP